MTPMTLGAPIDWSVAARSGAGAAPRPPRATGDEIAATQRGLAAAAERARTVAAETAQLPAATGATIVLDRPGWIRAACESFDAVFVGAPARTGLWRPVDAGRARLAGAETGALLAWLSARILGQFDPWLDRLVLVAPNVHLVQQQVHADPADFHLWVCLHEETHRLQFHTAGWLLEHLNQTAGQLVGRVDADWRVVARAVAGAVRGNGSVFDAIAADPETARLMDDATAMMSLLEGHADVMMDRVGTEVIPGVGRIRRRFEKRRRGTSRDRVFRRVLGLDAKLAQYHDGARFCRAVIDAVGVAGLNRVWSGPDALPSVAEIADPHAWVARVAGDLTDTRTPRVPS